jgi:solute carrier family 35 protein E1
MCSFESDNISWQRINEDDSKNMDAANVYAVVNIISFFCSVPFEVINEASALQEEWDTSVEKHGLQGLMTIIFLHLQ